MYRRSLRGIGVCAVAAMALTGCGAGVISSPSSLLPGSPASSPTPPSSSTGTSSPPPAGTSPANPSSGTTAPSTGQSSGATNGNTSSGTTPGNSSGSGTNPSTPSTPPVTVPATTVSGEVYSGQHRPVSGAKVFLFAVGSSGYGAGAKSLLASPGVTDSNGEFSLTDAYSCPTAETPVYLMSAGGDAGAGVNGGAVLMSALGACSQLGSSRVAVSEITTVASAYALAQFMAPGTSSIGASSTNSKGLLNAFRTVSNLYDGSTGVLRAKTPAGNGTVPVSKIDSLANVLANCVESTTSSLACTNLYQATTVAGKKPSDTLTSVLLLALHPELSLKSLTLSGPYQPSLAGAPNDWTLSVEYTGGGLKYGQLIAADGTGNIWVPNATNPGTLSEFDPAGEPLSGPAGFKGGGLNYPQAVAIDQAGNVWAANEGNDSVSKCSSSGAPLSGSGYTATGLKAPYALTLDGNGNVFTVNGNNTMTKLSSSGVEAGQFQQGALDFPYAVAVDRSQNVWVANYGYSNAVSKLSNGGTPAAANGYTGGGVSGAVGIAIDAGGNAWVASFDHAVLSKLSAAGSPLSGSGYTLPAGAASILVDGDNTVWTANSDGSISRFSNTGTAITPPTGFVSDGATAEVGIAIDLSGNVWTSDNYVNSLFEYIGAAAPTMVPLQVAVKNNLLGKRP
ncbi:MAG TPA: NHL repeat-containing protein [Edaphobacter sp.]|jgi:hypothetical protein|nr:NHL repeat-containing protein [Edaphobacter sp.]